MKILYQRHFDKTQMAQQSYRNQIEINFFL